MTAPARIPAEYQAAAALADLLARVPDAESVQGQDWVANTVVFTVNGVVFHAVVVVP